MEIYSKFPERMPETTPDVIAEECRGEIAKVTMRRTLEDPERILEEVNGGTPEEASEDIRERFPDEILDVPYMIPPAVSFGIPIE